PLHSFPTRRSSDLVPVAHLVFHLRLLRFARSYPYATTVPVNLARHHIPDGTRMDTLNRCAVIGLKTALQTHYHIKFLLFGNFCSSKDTTYTRYIYSHRLLHENVLSLLDSFFKVQWTKTWRRC